MQTAVTPETYKATRESIGTQADVAPKVACVAILLIAGILGFAYWNSPDLQRERQAKDAIRAQLAAPSTAKFSGIQSRPTRAPDLAHMDFSGVLITGHVDAQNASGAHMRQAFRVLIDDRGSVQDVRFSPDRDASMIAHSPE